MARIKSHYQRNIPGFMGFRLWIYKVGGEGGGTVEGRRDNNLTTQKRQGLEN